VRLALFPILRERSEAAIQSKAQENSSFVETARAIQSLKLLNREDECESHWLSRYADVVNANVRLGRVKVTFRTISDTIFGFENILVIYLAACLALDNVLTVGMIFAFMSYERHFTHKMVMLVEKALEFRILGLHLERLADTALTPMERGQDQPLAYTRPIAGRMEFRNVSFRYAETEPLILENVNLTVESGQFMIVMGPSGGGKTTLLKIMLGLFEPTSGEVLIGGTPLSIIRPRAYREQVGAVMQEDQLLSGSVADNICFLIMPLIRRECSSVPRSLVFTGRSWPCRWRTTPSSVTWAARSLEGRSSRSGWRVRFIANPRSFSSTRAPLIRMSRTRGTSTRASGASPSRGSVSRIGRI
jgi:ATP-binding cassette subfamily B protein RaxB